MFHFQKHSFSVHSEFLQSQFQALDQTFKIESIKIIFLFTSIQIISLTFFVFIDYLENEKLSWINYQAKILEMMNSDMKRKNCKGKEIMNINRLNAKKVFLLIQQKQLSVNMVQTVFSYLKVLLMKLDGDEYIYWLKYLARLMSMGYGAFLLNETLLQIKLIQMFNSSFEAFLADSNDRNFSYTIFQISIIADIIRSFPTIMYPYNKQFVRNAIKLSQFTSRNKQSQSKLNFIISTLCFSFTLNSQLIINENLDQVLKHAIVSHLRRSQKEKNLQEYDVLCKALENLIELNKNFRSQFEV